MARRKQGWQAYAARFCPQCGRELQREETCECSGRLPKDGLRAKCPWFKARSSYHGDHYIACLRKYRFAGRDARDLHYMTYCCGICEECPISPAKEGAR